MNRINTPMVLIIEDDSDMAHIIMDVYERNGWGVVWRTTVELALIEFLAQDFLLVQTDGELPDIDGVEVTRRILRLRPGQTVFMFSGSHSKREGFLAAGGFSFFDKADILKWAKFIDSLELVDVHAA